MPKFCWESKEHYTSCQAFETSLKGRGRRRHPSRGSQRSSRLDARRCNTHCGFGVETSPDEAEGRPLDGPQPGAPTPPLLGKLSWQSELRTALALSQPCKVNARAKRREAARWGRQAVRALLDDAAAMERRCRADRRATDSCLGEEAEALLGASATISRTRASPARVKK